MAPSLYGKSESLQPENSDILGSGAGAHPGKKIDESDRLTSSFGDSGNYLKPSQRLRMSLEQVLGLGELSELERLLTSPYAKPSQSLRTALNECLDSGRRGSWDVLFKELRAARWEAAALAKTIELVQSLLGSGTMAPETPLSEQTPVEPDSEPLENCDPSPNEAGRRRNLRKRASMNHAPLPVMNHAPPRGSTPQRGSFTMSSGFEPEPANTSTLRPEQVNQISKGAKHKDSFRLDDVEGSDLIARVDDGTRDEKRRSAIAKGGQQQMQGRQERSHIESLDSEGSGLEEGAFTREARQFEEALKRQEDQKLKRKEEQRRTQEEVQAREREEALKREEEERRMEEEARKREFEESIRRQEEDRRREEEERVQREIRERQEAKEREEAAMKQARECLRKAMDSILKSVDMCDIDSLHQARDRLEEMITDWRDDNLPEDDLGEAIGWQKRLTKACIICVLNECKEVDMNSMELLSDAKDQLAEVIKDARSNGMAETDLVEAESWRRKIHNRIEDLKGSIRVYCRTRPLSQKEIDQGDASVVKSLDGMTLEVEKSLARRRSRMSQDGMLVPPSQEDETDLFKFDAVFENASQQTVFQDCKDLVQSAFDGYNVTIFAYGQTGSGKTYTVTGRPDAPGLAPQMVTEIFRLVEQESDRFEHKVTCSMVELYKNELVDLLQVFSLAPNDKKVCVRQDKHGNVQVENVVEEECEDAAALMEVLERGTMCRTTAATAMNSASSRSHLIHTIKIYGVHNQTKEKFMGKMLLVDLAGSERLKKSLVNGENQKEAIEINKSLTALGDVIEALTQGHHSIPYRNHKLTQVLQDALGKTAKTLMFVHCSPAKSNLEETLASLKYATRAKGIQRSNSREPRGSSLAIPRGSSMSRGSTPGGSLPRSSVPRGSAAPPMHARASSRPRDSESIAGESDSTPFGTPRHTPRGRGDSVPRLNVVPPRDVPFH